MSETPHPADQFWKDFLDGFNRSMERTMNRLDNADRFFRRGARTIPAILWRGGRRVSHPKAWIEDPPPATVSVARPLVFCSLDELVGHLTQDDPVTEDYVLQYIAKEPRAAVYLYAPEALAQMDSA